MGPGLSPASQQAYSRLKKPHSDSDPSAYDGVLYIGVRQIRGESRPRQCISAGCERFTQRAADISVNSLPFLDYFFRSVLEALLVFLRFELGVDRVRRLTNRFKKGCEVFG